MGLVFTISGFAMRTPENFEKIAKDGYLFWKNPFTWVHFFEKITPEHGYGS